PVGRAWRVSRAISSCCRRGPTTAGMFSKLAKENERELLLEALRQLPLDFQIALELTYWERLTAEECGTILGIPANTVSGRIRRGKKKLGEILDSMSQSTEPRPRGSSDVERWMEEIHGFVGGDPRVLLAEIGASRKE